MSPRASASPSAADVIPGERVCVRAISRGQAGSAREEMFRASCSRGPRRTLPFPTTCANVPRVSLPDRCRPKNRRTGRSIDKKRRSNRHLLIGVRPPPCARPRRAGPLDPGYVPFHARRFLSPLGVSRGQNRCENRRICFI